MLFIEVLRYILTTRVLSETKSRLVYKKIINSDDQIPIEFPA